MHRRNGPETRSSFNKLNLLVKSKLAKFRQSNLESKFKNLKNFNQSCSDQWKTINSFLDDTDAKAQPNTLFSDSLPFTDHLEIAEKLGKILSSSFGNSAILNHLPTHVKTNSSSEITINQAEFDNAILNCSKNSAPGIDRISNRLISNSPSNIKNLIFEIFNHSLIRPHGKALEKIQNNYDPQEGQFKARFFIISAYLPPKRPLQTAWEDSQQKDIKLGRSQQYPTPGTISF